MSKKYVEVENKGVVKIHDLNPGKRKRLEIDRDGTIIDKLFRRRVSDPDEIIVLTTKSQKLVGSIKDKIKKMKEKALEESANPS